MCRQKVKGSKYFKTEAQVLMMHLLPIILIEIPDDHTVSENRDTVSRNNTLLNLEQNIFILCWGFCVQEYYYVKNTGICTTGKQESAPRKHLPFIK